MAETLATSAGAGAETQIKTAVVRRPRRPVSLAVGTHWRTFCEAALSWRNRAVRSCTALINLQITKTFRKYIKPI